MKVWVVNCNWYDADTWNLGIFTSLGLAACAVNNHLFNDGCDACITKIEWDGSGTFCNIYLSDSDFFPTVVGCAEIGRVTVNEL